MSASKAFPGKARGGFPFGMRKKQGGEVSSRKDAQRNYSGMKRLPVGAAALGILLTLSACASQVMKSYIGAPISSVMLDYGPPDNVYNLRPGERAYQWRKQKTQVMPGQSSGEIRETRHGRRFETTETPGYVEHTECFYTFYTRSSGSDWYVTSFRQPSLECE
ncbi:hypothetical protein GGD46_005478 [Rhizobium lusitanum]|uniref:Uncharacterized protein n=2 Tax=Rhizobium/Agrobacterium group TaxID=227290 RepID=A0A7X0MEP5_9HYPH|nr:hypothetical protein [Rhizobium lusitanum]